MNIASVCLMNATSYIVLALYFTIPVGMLILCGTLLRASARRAGSPNRLVRDLRPWEGTLVDFVAHSNASSAILSTLATRRRPMSFRVLVDELKRQFARDEERNDAPLSLPTVLFVLQLALLVRMSRAGFRLTEAGHEVHRRIRSRTGSALPLQLEDRQIFSEPQQSRGTEPLLVQTHERVLRAA